MALLIKPISISCVKEIQKHGNEMLYLVFKFNYKLLNYKGPNVTSISPFPINIPINIPNHHPQFPSPITILNFHTQFLSSITIYNHHLQSKIPIFMVFADAKYSFSFFAQSPMPLPMTMSIPININILITNIKTLKWMSP